MNKFEWWAIREDKTDKIDYEQIPINMLTRLAIHYTEWWVKHWEWNWKKWDEEFQKWCKKSRYRHFMQWANWETDEDHMRSVVWNLFTYEYLNEKITRTTSK